MTPREAGQRLGISRLAVEGRIIAAGWVMQMGRTLMTTTVGQTSGCVQPITEQRQAHTGPLVVETGFEITAKGLSDLRAGVGAPAP